MTDKPKILHDHDQYLERPSYTFLRTVGIGAAGKSRVGMNHVLGRRVVSKTISLFDLPGGVAKGEPRILEEMDHPRLVRVREAQWASGYDPALKIVTFTTDFCEGLSVAAALAAPLPATRSRCAMPSPSRPICWTPWPICTGIGG